MIYLLGTSLYRRRSESIFCTEAPGAQHTADYFLLILLGDFVNKESHEWQDQIEYHCNAVVPVTTIVLKTSAFDQWLKEGHPFATAILYAAPVVYKEDNIALSIPEGIDKDANYKTLHKGYLEGLHKSKEFFTGAELFIIREQYNMAAFMLHQATEQALRTILKVGTGYHSCTHNLDRLIRYASMVSYKLPDIFPRKSDKEKQLFRLLQKAYSDTRYTDEYKINNQELGLITGKVASVINLLAGFEKTINDLPIFQKQPNE